MQRLCGESEVDLQRFGEPHDIEIEDVPGAQLFVPIFSIDEAVDQHVEAGGAEAMELDDVVVLTHTGAGLDDGPDPLNERL